MLFDVNEGFDEELGRWVGEDGRGEVDGGDAASLRSLRGLEEGLNGRWFEQGTV